MNNCKIEPILIESGIIEKDGIYFHEASDFAKKHLFYPYWGAVYTCDIPYRVSRLKDYPKVYLLFFILEGELHVKCNGRHQIARKDEVIFLDCSIPHQYWAEKLVTFQWLHFEGAFTNVYYELLSKNGVKHSDKLEISLLLDNILNHIKNKDSNEHRLSAYIYDILTILTIHPPLNESPAVKSAVHYMSQHYREAPSVEQIARGSFSKPPLFLQTFQGKDGPDSPQLSPVPAAAEGKNTADRIHPEYSADCRRMRLYQQYPVYPCFQV